MIENIKKFEPDEYSIPNLKNNKIKICLNKIKIFYLLNIRKLKNVKLFSK